MVNSREKLMKQIQTYAFAAHEANLYLDAHPDSKSALEYFKRHKMMEKKATEEYECRFGPITVNAEMQSWEWVKGPWPWQNDACGRD